MAAYVDALQVWPNAHGIFRAGSCHLAADTLDELHEFAARLGMRRAWFQSGKVHRRRHLDPRRLLRGPRGPAGQHPPPYRPAGEVIDTRRFEVAAIDGPGADNIARAFVVAHHYSASYPAARERIGL